MPIKNIVTGQKVTKEKLQRAKELRREMTPAEKILWEELRANKLGVHFRRQQIIQGFIIDFYCHNAGLAIEVDGNIARFAERGDERRRRCCPRWGWVLVLTARRACRSMVCFGNDEVVRNLSHGDASQSAAVGNIK